MASKKLGVLKIFGQEVKVETPEHMDDGVLGLCWYDQKKIEIRPGLTKEEFAETLFHELLHAVFHRMGYRQSGIPHEVEEIMVDQIGKVLSENNTIIQKMLKK